MTTYIVTEYEADAAMLKRLLADWDDIKVIARGSKMGAISFAKTMSVNNDEPAVVVLNAYTENEDALQVQRSEFQDLVMPLPSDIAPILILGTPTIATSLDHEVSDKLEDFLSGADLSQFRYMPRP
jgi:hypothetical protein